MDHLKSIQIATEQDASDWSSFVRAMPDFNHAFSWAWKVIIAKVFGHKPHYLVGRDSKNEIVAVAPLFEVSSLLFGKALISVPYLSGGGILATTPEARTALLEHIVALSKQLGSNYLELRHREEIELSYNGLQKRSHKVAMIRELGSSAEDLFSSFSAKLRSQIRRPEKDGITAKVRNDEQGVNDFYAVFSRHMRDLGTPVYPRRLFLEVQKQFGRQAQVIVAYDKSRPVSAGISIGAGETTEILWASSLREYSKSSPNMLMYWKALEQACLDGYRCFGFGRSTPGSGTYQFKKQWGTNELPLHWYYHINRGEVPDVNPKSKKYAMLVNCWQRLPLPLANVMGPWLTRSLP